MAEYGPAFRKLISIEGGYVNDAQDRGGETRFGISKRAYPDLDIANLTMLDARAIYRRDYWDCMSLDGIRLQQIAEELFDTAVNCGVRTAVRFLQESLNLVRGHKIGPLKTDGIIGQKTISACNQCRYSAALLKAMNGLQFMRYYTIIEKDPVQKRFFRGWLRRVWESTKDD